MRISDGVQTCALPIFGLLADPLRLAAELMQHGHVGERYGQAEGMRQLSGEVDCLARFPQGEIGSPEMPVAMSGIGSVEDADADEIGRASCRERGWQYV